MGVYQGAGRGIKSREVVQLIVEAGLEGRALARARGLPVPETFAVYLNTQGDLVISSSGAGTGLHAEDNVQATCLQQGIPFQGGRIVNYNFENRYFIPSCDECKIILEEHGPIRDMTDCFVEHISLAMDILREMGPSLSV